MELLLSPIKVLRRSVGAVLVPSIPIIILILYLFAFEGVANPNELLTKTDYYLGGNMYLAAANLTAYNDLSTNIQIPLVRLGGIAERANLKTLMDGPAEVAPMGVSSIPAQSGSLIEFMIAVVVLTLGFLSYAMVCNVVHSHLGDKPGMFGFAGINGASIALSILGSLIMVFFASFYLAGFKLIVVITFGLYFTFAMPYAAVGMPLGESMYRGFNFVARGASTIIVLYLGCMGAAIMIPVGILIVLFPLIFNLGPDQTSLAILLKVVIGLFSIVVALFYQMALCANVIFSGEEFKPHSAQTEESA